MSADLATPTSLHGICDGVDVVLHVYGRGPFRNTDPSRLVRNPGSPTSLTRAAAEDSGGIVLRPHLVVGAGLAPAADLTASTYHATHPAPVTVSTLLRTVATSVSSDSGREPRTIPAPASAAGLLLSGRGSRLAAFGERRLPSLRRYTRYATVLTALAVLTVGVSLTLRSLLTL
ncbi:hypothetical protein [Streptomyces sp. APSN-46.1]|uniref:hypothetical protein n=1 Tax=Streptomyces sp. APSN-46.1 TaxID=2929049 RepID=UPI0027E54BA5|nr:hypothetical protein [Streptomyces sp. APSN-46.1]